MRPRASRPSVGPRTRYHMVDATRKPARTLGVRNASVFDGLASCRAPSFVPTVAPGWPAPPTNPRWRSRPARRYRRDEGRGAAGSKAVENASIPYTEGASRLPGRVHHVISGPRSNRGPRGSRPHVAADDAAIGQGDEGAQAQEVGVGLDG